jgi:2-polyprenyl-3-methyl-5-hydroxy-6-metoxy-1,4-benzoquinol methylase
MTALTTECPLCGNEGRLISGNRRGLHGCGRCAVVYNSNYGPLNYERRYFEEDYKNQYSKTYLEDYANIRNISLTRLGRILDLICGKKASVVSTRTKNIDILDIGCAMGFFLKCAMDAGVRSADGIEISRFASDYCRNELHLNVINAPFDTADITKEYDIVTAWYFLEHSPDPSRTLKKIHKILRPGGVFAFSAPSLFGPQYLFDRKSWIDFSPRSVTRYLRKIGFTKIKIRPGGVHPERLFPVKMPLYGYFKKLYLGLSVLLTFSDTMEVYAVK